MGVADVVGWWAALTVADRLTLIAAIATFIAMIATLIAVLVAIRQLRDVKKIAAGQFWLTLRGVI